MFAIGWLVGWALRERTERTEEAEERAARAEQEREAAARVAVAEERARIARELHDVVAHAVSVIVLQVGAVRHRMPESASADREALRNVEEAGRTALAEMRRLLNAMRDEGDTAELAPHPGLADLDRLAPRRRRGRDGGRPAGARRAGAPPRGPRPLGVPDRAGGAHQQPQALGGGPRRGHRGLRARRAPARGARPRRPRRDRPRRARPRAGRDPRAREDLRRRDVGRTRSRRRVPRPRPAAPERGPA